MRFIENDELVEWLASMPSCGEDPHHYDKEPQGLILFNPGISKIHNNCATGPDETA